MAEPIGEEWEDKMLQAINNQTALHPADSIPRLGKWIYQLSNNPSFESPSRPVYNAAVEMLTSIPGHAEFYEKRIRRLWDEAMADHEAGRDTASVPRYFSETRFDFPVLRHLPSPETVRVLGDMILETRKINGTPGDFPDLHLASRALQELHHLPLATRPITSSYVDSDNDLETYRLWYSQIKAGNRTFRFEGDPNEYTLAGPVRSSPEVASTPPKARDSANASPSAETGPNSSTPWLAITLGGTLIVGAIWYWFVSRRKA